MILYQPLSDSYNTSVFTHSSYVYSKKTARTLTPTLCETAVVRGPRGPRAVLKFHLCVRRSGVLGVEMKTLRKGQLNRQLCLPVKRRCD